MANPWDDAPIIQKANQVLPSAPSSANPWDEAPIIQSSQPNQPEANPERGWTDTLVTAATNLPSSTYNMAKGIGEAVLNPGDTLQSIGDLAAGEIGKMFPSLAKSNLRQQESEQAATAFNDIYKKGYGSVEGFKERLATDPMAVVGDLSTVLTGGGAAASKLGAISGASKAAKLGEALSSAGNMTNPISFVPKAVGKSAELAGSAIANTLGSPFLTGVGGQTVKTAFNSGKSWNPDFMKNVTGQVPIDDVLHAAKDNLQKMSEAKSNAYKSGMIDISKDKSVLQFKGIDSAVSDATGKASYGGKVVNDKAYKAVQDAKQAIDQWKSGDPAIFATPEGMDKLKQKIGAIQESIPFEEKTARLAVGGIYNSIKSEISKQAPTYAKTMSEYQGASKQIDEITKTLSLSPSAQADTAIRKLQSLTRNNVNANYGRRAELADMLINKGGKDIMPALSGQAMNDWFGRGIGSHIGTGAIGATAAAANPLAALLLPLQSPKIVGVGANALGYAAGAPGKALGAIPGSKLLTKNANKAKATALLLQQLQQGNE